MRWCDVHAWDKPFTPAHHLHYRRLLPITNALIRNHCIELRYQNSKREGNKVLSGFSIVIHNVDCSFWHFYGEESDVAGVIARCVVLVCVVCLLGACVLIACCLLFAVCLLLACLLHVRCSLFAGCLLVLCLRCVSLLLDCCLHCVSCLFVF